MIPSIEDIVDGLISGRIPKQQALAWLMQHMALVRESVEMDFKINASKMQ